MMEKVKFKSHDMIAELAKGGFHVDVDHTRVTDTHGHVVEPRGGQTTVVIRQVDRKGPVIATGKAVCSKHDNYNRRVGTRIALGRAVAVLSGIAEAREERKHVRTYP